jgi:hypothetical protein
VETKKTSGFIEPLKQAGGQTKIWPKDSCWAVGLLLLFSEFRSLCSIRNAQNLRFGG